MEEGGTRKYVGDWADAPGGQALEQRDDDDGDVDPPPVEKKTRHHHVFQSSWIMLVPWLFIVRVLSAASVCSYGGEACVGCDVCSAMFCSLCIERGTGPCSNSAANKFKDGGCSVFYAKAARAHCSHYHEGDLDKAQPTVVAAFSKQIVDHKAKILDIMKIVYTPCKKKVPLRQIKDWVYLAGLLGVGLGLTYVNNHAARDFALSIAFAIRQRIIDAARSSVCLWLMVDEATGVSHTGQMVLYLRLLIAGIFVTKFEPSALLNENTR